MSRVIELANTFNIVGPLLSSELLWRHTTFRIGGPADYYARPYHLSDLQNLFAMAQAQKMDYFILGGGSNLLVSDAGFRGLVIDMHQFNEFFFEDDILILGAGLSISDAVWRAGAQGFSGLDFLFGMPGTVGGALWMNARCYGSEIADSYLWAEVMDSSGSLRRVFKKEDEWGYKRSPFQTATQPILRAAFSLKKSDPSQLKKAMCEKRDDRETKGHYRFPCAGSIFKNNPQFGFPSGTLIDRCGLKNWRVGGASVSPWHGNIFINDRGASASNLQDLLRKVRERVAQDTGYLMEPEILSIGATGGSNKP